MIRCLAIDDEPLALKQIEAYLRKVPFFELAGCCQSALDAMAVLEAQEIDVMFIDINMPDLNGLDFVRSLNHPPMVVFTTAYQEYAIDGYKVSAIDYLLKPFGMGDVLRAADKVKRQYDLMHTATLSHVDEDDALFLKTEYKVVRIQVSDIVCVEGMSEYLRIHLSHASHADPPSAHHDGTQPKPIVALLSMKKMEERLPATHFMRVHKSYIVNLHHITEIQKNRILLDQSREIPIGDSYRDRLNDYVNRKFLGK